MYRLKVVSAPKNSKPATGSSIEVLDGECAIGRNSSNQIVLNSGNVSKRHAILVVDNTKVLLKDNGSSNGTFVNGELTLRRQLNVGDKISIGEYIFELKTPIQTNPSPSKILPFPQKKSSSTPLELDFGSPLALDIPTPYSPEAPAPEVAAPTSIVGRLKHLLEHRILPYFYEMNTKHEWRILGIGLIGLFMVATSLIGIWPLIDAHEQEFSKELERKARMVAIEIAERNSAFVANRQDSKTDIGTFSRASINGIRGVFILDLGLKVIAPVERAGQMLGAGVEAQFINQARKVFAERLDNDGIRGKVKKLDNGSIVAVEPIRAYSHKAARNVIVGMSAVVIDGDAAVLSGGEVAVAFGYALIVSAALAAFIFYILYRVTLKPIAEMNDKIDQSLRGEFVEFKSTQLFEELNPLWSVIDSALKRIPREGEGSQNNGGSSGLQGTDLLPSLKSIAELSSTPMAVFDEGRLISYLNGPFEEITGIRNDANLGQQISFAARDQGFISLVEDLFNRVISGGDGIQESFEFSGVAYKVSVVSFGVMGTSKGMTLSLYKEDAFGT